jgi:hypothetical protein
MHFMAVDSTSSEGNTESSETMQYEHVFEGERCVFCNVNVYDNDMYNDGALCEVTEGRPKKWAFGSVMGSPNSLRYRADMR